MLFLGSGGSVKSGVERGGTGVGLCSGIGVNVGVTRLRLTWVFVGREDVSVGIGRSGLGEVTDTLLGWHPDRRIAVIKRMRLFAAEVPILELTISGPILEILFMRFYGLALIPSCCISLWE